MGVMIGVGGQNLECCPEGSVEEVGGGRRRGQSGAPQSGADPGDGGSGGLLQNLG